MSRKASVKSKAASPASKPSLTLVSEPDAYFHELIQSAFGRQKVEAQPETAFYLVKLLGRFLTTDRLYSRDAEGHVKEEPIALLLKEAIEAPQVEQQRVLFRQAGDVSLYTAGYFQDSLTRKLVDVGYYIELGGKAYQLVAERAEERTLRGLYAELAEKFAKFVDVLAEVSDLTTPKTEKDLLRIYELWSRTGSERAAKILQQAGITTVPGGKKGVQQS